MGLIRIGCCKGFSECFNGWLNFGLSYLETCRNNQDSVVNLHTDMHIQRPESHTKRNLHIRGLGVLGLGFDTNSVSLSLSLSLCLALCVLVDTQFLRRSA